MGRDVEVESGQGPICPQWLERDKRGPGPGPDPGDAGSRALRTGPKDQG